MYTIEKGTSKQIKDMFLEECIDSLTYLHEQCEENIQIKINNLVKYVVDKTSSDINKDTLLNYIRQTKDFMNNYNLWINNSLAELQNIVQQI